MTNLIEDTVKTMDRLARMQMNTGQLQMQSVVLGWLNRNRSLLSPGIIHELVDAMDAALIRLGAGNSTSGYRVAHSRTD